MKFLTVCRVICRLVVGVAAIGVTATAWGTGCIQGPAGTANPILFAKGKQSCDTIYGYVGCTVDKGNGTCDIKDPVTNATLSTITSTINPVTGAMSWSSTGPAKVFAGGLNGIQSGNACVYFYPGGEGTTQYGLGFNTATSNTSPTYTNIQESYFCTDLNTEVVTTESDIQPCQSTNPAGGLIEGVNCGNFADGTIVSVWTPTYDASGAVTGSSLEQCYCNDNDKVAGSYACNISGEDDGDPNTLEDCFSSKPLGEPTLISTFPGCHELQHQTGIDEVQLYR